MNAERKGQEFAAPDDLSEGRAGQNFGEPGVSQVTDDDGAAGREDLHARNRLPDDAALEDFADDFEFGERWAWGR